MGFFILRTLDILACRKLSHMPPGLGELRDPANGQLRDLKNLNDLSGYLEIELNGELKDPASEAKEANLISKHGLTQLHIVSTCYGNGSKHEEVLLEGLKPPLNLKKLKINRYFGEKLPSWAMGDSLCTTLPNLVEIHLSYFTKCREVPCFSQLPSLKRLILRYLRKVEHMEKSLSTRTFFPSLQELVLLGMDDLKEWWEEAKVVNCNDKEELSELSTLRPPVSPSFSGLIKLQIDNCPGLVSFPVSPNVEELKLAKVNKELTVLKKVTNSGWSSDVGSSKLRSLIIDDVEVLVSIPIECLGHLISLEIVRASELKNTSELVEVFKHLSSLTTLKFSYCDKLTSISVGIEHLVSMETLILEGCWELDLPEKGEIEDGMPWKALQSLRVLHFHGLIASRLPSGLKHLTNLRHLQLHTLRNLRELPKWIGCFSSLHSMDILNCPLLRCLPEEVRNLTSLNELIITVCDGLTKRCRGPNGADWPYIRHIPFLAVYDNLQSRQSVFS